MASNKSPRGIGPVPDGLSDNLRDFLTQVKRQITDVVTGRVTVAGGSSNSGGTTVVIGGGGTGGGGDDEPDLTPPPTPSGVSVFSGFAYVGITTDAPIFTQGHGYLRTVVYAKKYAGTGPLPTFSDDSKQTEFTGEIGTFPSDLGVEWHVWLKWQTNDGELSVSPAGGTNGFTTTTGKVGTSDLGNAIVLSQNLAPGSVTADKSALDIGGSNLVGNNSFDLDSNGDGIADGWALYDGTGGGSLSRVAGRISGYAQRYTTTAAVNTWPRGVSGGAGLAWQPGKTYVVSYYAKAPAGSGFLGKTHGLQWNTAPAVTDIKNPGLTTAWQRYAFRLVWGASVEPIGPLYLSVPYQGTPTGSWDIDDLQVEEGDTLTAYAGKLALNTIVAGDGAIANLAITNALIANLAVDDAKIASLVVSKLLAGSLAVGQYIRSTSYVAGVSGWAINANGTAEFAAASIRGQMTAAQINTNGLIVRDNAGNPILGAGNALSAAYAAPGTLNSAVSIGANGALSGGGGGQVTNLPIPDTRAVNTPPSGYGVVHIKEFKDQAVVGIPGGATGTYCVVETLKGWSDSSGGQALQWAYVDSSTVYKRSAAPNAGSWGGWVRDLDRNLYTGDLNATYGATIGANLLGTFNQATWDVVMTTALIRAAHIGSLFVSTVSNAVNGGSTATGGIGISNNRIDFYNEFGQLQARLGLQ